MTRVVHEIDRSSVSDRESFRAKVIEACEPVVLRGLCRDWPATRAAEQSWEALAEYLLRFDSGTVAQAFVGERSIGGRYYYSDDLTGFNFERVDMAYLMRLHA